MTRPVIYIAGPYTSPDPSTNVTIAIEFADVLMDLGVCWPLVPHLTHLWHGIRPRPYEDWLALDLALLERCDGLIRITGPSPGADREVARARELGLPTMALTPGQAGAADQFIAWMRDHFPEVLIR